VPSKDEVRRYYQSVWQASQRRHAPLIKTLLYTGVHVAELVAVRIRRRRPRRVRIRITLGKGAKDRVVPFPHTFRESLALHIAERRKTGGNYLFESSFSPTAAHASSQSLGIYSRLALSDAQASHDQAIGRFPV